MFLTCDNLMTSKHTGASTPRSTSVSNFRGLQLYLQLSYRTEREIYGQTRYQLTALRWTDCVSGVICRETVTNHGV